MTGDPLHDMRDREDARTNYMDGYRTPGRGEPRSYTPAPTLRTFDTGGCWCGKPQGHDWPGMADGVPHPKAAVRKVAPPQTEAQFQAAVVDLARWRGWLVYFVPDSRRSPAGWPDLTLCRRGRLIFAELKSANGKVRHGQLEWLKALDEAPGVTAVIWRPDCWPEIELALA